ncbi:vWA domain-containing protein [Clostridium ganghwense]|uniref:BatA and WFA domain-containing protein n=1 Tax=Clostridium ganghwense TaxID=312089 RepID=A0ABT4CRA6_9CLOT|nr:BatA and WFA domain-containing protein [Clostridium ganghwense]MCY6371597.1 BatA and WFA domain-containing protein [Clostridium ganghwense]
MTLFSPKFLWFLLFIPPVILMYILKQKFEEKKISSIYLWNNALKDIEVNTPWQKLKKNLLLFMQILLILLIIFAAANPFLNLWGKNYNNLIIVIDNSGSMNAVYQKTTRLEEAKNRAEVLVKGTASGSKISVISSGKNQKVEISGSSNKDEVINKIKAIESSNSRGNINDSISLVKSIAKQYEDYQAVFYSDSNVELKNINGENISLASRGENVSLDYISNSLADNKIKSLVRITNRSDKELQREVSLFGDEDSKLIDVRSIKLKPKETVTIVFDNYDSNYKSVYAEITEKDALVEDNIIYSIVKQPKLKKVLLVSDRNIFIEKALLPINSIELYKAKEVQDIEEGYDLYVFDGKAPDKMPEKGSILFINPLKDNEAVKIKGEVQGGKVQVADHPITKYIRDAKFAVSKVRDISIPYWGETLLNVNSKSIAFVGEHSGRKIGVIGFDLHNSDFPLNAEFPIFINQISSYFLGDNSIQNNRYFCGEEVNINPSPNSKKIYIKTPDNKKEEIENKYPIRPFENTIKSGIYTLTQKNDSGESKNMFAVNFPSESESNINVKVEGTRNSVMNNSSVKSMGISIQWILILFALVFMMIEWFIYAKRV